MAQKSSEAGRSSLEIEVYKTPKKEDFRDKKTGKNSLANIEEVHRAIECAARAAGIGVIKKDVPELRGRGAFKPAFFDEMEGLKEAFPDLALPRSETYAEFRAKPTFPVVAKNTLESHGRCKYLIEDADTWAKFEAWVAEMGQADLVGNSWAFQEYVESPGSRPTSYRVLVDCRGEILTSQLLYGSDRADDRRVLISDRLTHQQDCPEAKLEDPSSPFFLNARAIAANRMFALLPGANKMEDPKTGKVFDPKEQRYFHVQTQNQVGGRISLDRIAVSHRISDGESAILKDHGLHGTFPTLPKDLAQQSSEIGKKVGIENGKIMNLWTGIDWVTSRDGKAKLLEVNRRPSLTSLRDHLGGADTINEHNLVIWLIRSTLGKAGHEFGIKP